MALIGMHGGLCIGLMLVCRDNEHGERPNTCDPTKSLMHDERPDPQGSRKLGLSMALIGVHGGVCIGLMLVCRDKGHGEIPDHRDPC